MSRRPRLAAPLAAALGAAAILAWTGAAAGVASTHSSWGRPSFLVQPRDGDNPELGLTLELAQTASAPAQIAVYVPPGFAIYPQRPDGLAVGQVEIYATDYTAGATGETLLEGQVTAATL